MASRNWLCAFIILFIHSSDVRFSAHCGGMRGISTGNGMLESFKQVQEHVRLLEVGLQLTTDAGGIEHVAGYISRNSIHLGHDACSPSLFLYVLHAKVLGGKH